MEPLEEDPNLGSQKPSRCLPNPRGLCFKTSLELKGEEARQLCFVKLLEEKNS
jgi:hypothetical protein